MIYKVTTNEGEFYVNRKPTIEDMGKYVKRMRERGYKLSEMIYSWCPIRVSTKVW